MKIQQLKDTFEKDYYSYILNHEISWKNIFNKLYESIKDVDVIVVNSSRNSTKLDYDRHPNGYRVIAVGGLALSRGLTLEGLVTSYFYRNTATFDVLMQMGRWFGYRDGYQDLVRIYMNADSAQYYKEISESIEDLKSDIEKMKADGKTPLEYGIRVRNGSEALGITAANKMRNARVRKVVKSFYGNVFETPYLDRNLNIETQNIDKTISFLNSLPNENLDSSITYPYFRNISASSVVKLIGQLKFNEANSYFDNNQLIKFINKHESDMPFYDIYVIGGSVKDKESPKFNNDLSVPLVKRRFDVPRKYLIRINAQRAHLWGKSDTSVGLTKVQKQFVLDHTSGTATDYFNVPGGRNPLLIIYFIDPINKDDWKGQLESLGYKNVIFKLDSLNLGIPQHRQRLIMLSVFVGKNGSTERKKKIIDTYFANPKNNLNDRRLPLKPLSSILKTDYSNATLFEEAKLSQPNDTKSRLKIWNRNAKLLDQKGNCARNSATITTKQDRHPNSGNVYFDYHGNTKSKFRYLTPRECMLLMGFDDKDYESLIENNPDYSRSTFFARDKIYKLAGNSIVVNVLEQVFDAIVNLDALLRPYSL